MPELGLKFVGKDPNNVAKPISVNTNGELLVSGKSDITVYSKSNPLAPRNAGDYELREATSKIFVFPHLWTPYNQPGYNIFTYRNIFDQIFVISSTYDAIVSIQFQILEASGSYEVSYPLYGINLGVIDASNGTTKKKMILTPEKSSLTVDGYNQVIELPELRQPFPSFGIKVTTESAPTKGEFLILNARRY